jgi:hypothetical protein
MWSRGQSWAIYGYTMVYRYTKDKRFLDFAQKVTDIYLKRLKETSDDWVPYWDMDDPEILEMKSEKVNFGSSERHESLLSNGRVATKVSEAKSEKCDDDGSLEELKRAAEVGISVVVLVEHGADIKTLEDVAKWENRRLKESPLAVSGERLYKMMRAIEYSYNTRFEFCTKAQTGRRIVEILTEDRNGNKKPG